VTVAVGREWRSGRGLVHRRLNRAATGAIARIRPVAPPPVRSAVLYARSVAGSGPVVLRPQVERALVVAPHPDDETIGCGGTLAGLAARRSEVRCVLATAGEASVAEREAGRAGTARTRRSKAEDACRVLGLAPPRFLDLPDGALDGQREALSTCIGELVADFDPQAIFAPWPLDDHPDHQAVAPALAAVPLATSVEVWMYEVWSTLPANRIVDISDRWDAKVQALRCHEHGHRSADLSAHLALARWRSLFGLDGQGYAEAFLVTDPEGLRDLVRWRASRESP
jgi:N-acetylglucosamine malate deacetylase 1